MLSSCRHRSGPVATQQYKRKLLFLPLTACCRDELVIKTGSWVGGLLVDGLGDGAMIEAEGEDLDFLRTTSFGLLQVRFCLRCGFCLRCPGSAMSGEAKRQRAVLYISISGLLQVRFRVLFAV